MKILFIIRSLGNGGAERQLTNLVVKLKGHGYTVKVCIFYKGGIYQEFLIKEGIEVICLDKRGRWDLIPFMMRLMKTIYRIKPDIIHGYLPESNIISILAKALYPNTKVVFGIRSSNIDLTKYDLISYLSYKAEVLLSRFANLIIANSNKGKAYFISCGGPEKKIQVVPNGVDTKHFSINRLKNKSVRADLGIQENTYLVGLVGRADPMKDHVSFLKAAAILSERRNDICFLCVGGGDLQRLNDLVQLSYKLGLEGKVFWGGERKDMVHIYNCLDILCSSSVSEGFSNAIAEGMSCGVPCVVTGVGDSPWIVGDTGIVVSSNNPEELAAGIEKMLSYNLEALGMKARERIVNNFSIDDLAVRTIDALKKMN